MLTYLLANNSANVTRRIHEFMLGTTHVGYSKQMYCEDQHQPSLKLSLFLLTINCTQLSSNQSNFSCAIY